jgi:hypothetical protein
MPVRRIDAGYAQHLTRGRAYSGYEIAYYQLHNMQYINLAIPALTPAVAPSPAACLGRERKEWRYCNFYI